MFDVFGSFSPVLLAFLAVVLFAAGMVRGFSGFGAGMIFMPVASSVMPPSTAAATFLIIDSIVAAPLMVRAVRLCEWPTILPAVLGSVIIVQFGAWLLATIEILVLRWVIFAIVVSLLALLMSGWRYHRRPSAPASFTVGGISGLFGGISQVSAPPMVAFWLASSRDPAVVRANLIVFFPLASIGTFVAYAYNGFFTVAVFQLLIMAVPVYGMSLYLGSRSFKSASPNMYRKLAYVLIALAAVTSMPVLDPILR